MEDEEEEEVEEEGAGEEQDALDVVATMSEEPRFYMALPSGRPSPSPALATLSPTPRGSPGGAASMTLVRRVTRRSVAVRPDPRRMPQTNDPDRA